MNAIIANKYADILNVLDIEVSKKLEGEYTVEEIISTFGNFFFNKMFLDITAIKDYKNITNLQKLSMNLNMDKIILFLDKEDPISDSKVFLSKLVSMGIYNFTSDSNNLMYLFTNPNAYRDVAYYQDIDNTEVQTNISQYSNTGIKRIIGIKNVTDSAGATTLIHLLKKELDKYYKTMILEIDKRDFIYFKEEAATIKEEELSEVTLKYSDIQVFLVDLNNSRKDYLCTDTLFLIEPSTIRLNKAMLINPKVFSELMDKKVVLNKNLLDEDDISNFEVETGIKLFYTIPPLNDKKDNSNILLPLLSKMGYIALPNEVSEEPKKSGFLNNLFK